MTYKDDTLHLFLALMCNAQVSVDLQAKAIRKCAKTVSARTKDKPYKVALKAIRNTKDDSLVVKAVSKAMQNYFLQLDIRANHDT